MPYESWEADPLWKPEYSWAGAAGLPVGLFDVETLRLWPKAPAAPALYRGWMLTEPEYKLLEQVAPVLISHKSYLSAHLASGWYEAIREYTFASTFQPASHLPDFSAGQRYFVKGLVKSFGPDSVVASGAEWQELLRKHGVLSDELLFVRQYAELQPDSERRYLVVGGVAYGAEGKLLPKKLEPALFQLRPRLFYSLDVALTAAGHPIIVEVGDGQVSDLKEWDVADFGRTVLRALAAVTQA
ncbi:ATP-grasp domain-containing protein [Hymenobacter sp. HSC-4F20]|uniref:ATP-grasp domain-containing protein n=1 Tax=Hymenobacter sp. HSC-4F20 TaxID=2864135 RepID=UPI001C7362D0|nr:ATP-grasp domain-containing protein [Hymenobacter sp. HSC-4F20]MBX0291883.1 ATP-grasp domain-containing protein [Hymenobacter sp. HSC-4F20]